jgi:hypothetical protein
LLAPGGIIGVA